MKHLNSNIKLEIAINKYNLAQLAGNSTRLYKKKIYKIS